VPAALTVGVAVVPPETMPGPDQLKLTAPVDDEPFNIAEADEQFNVCAVPAFAFGCVVLEVTATCPLALHPLPGSVTVKVYDPAAFTVGLVVVPPETIPGPDQLNVVPAVEEEPFNTADVVAQVSDCGVPAFTFGDPAAAFTIIWSEAEQPLTVTVTV
jgi:hypothetical protein